MSFDLKEKIYVWVTALHTRLMDLKASIRNLFSCLVYLMAHEDIAVSVQFYMQFALVDLFLLQMTSRQIALAISRTARFK
jgi:hypothetical protein